MTSSWFSSFDWFSASLTVSVSLENSASGIPCRATNIILYPCLICGMNGVTASRKRLLILFLVTLFPCFLLTEMPMQLDPVFLLATIQEKYLCCVALPVR